MPSRGCLVVLSGGADSTTCLAWAMKEFKGPVHALTVNYGQRHAIEIESARKVASILGVDSHEVLVLGPVLKGMSPLVSGNEVGHYSKPEDMPGGIEPTFVPMRNLLFITLAANRAVVKGLKDIVLGVCEADYGGYPDCRSFFIEKAHLACAAALGSPLDAVNICTPLMNLTKKQSVELACTLPGCMEALAYSHTCYDGQYPPNPFNHASMIRARGFHEAKVADPLILRAISEGKLPTTYPISGYVVDTPYGDPKTYADTVKQHL